MKALQTLYFRSMGITALLVMFIAALMAYQASQRIAEINVYQEHLQRLATANSEHKLGLKIGLASPLAQDLSKTKKTIVVETLLWLAFIALFALSAMHRLNKIFYHAIKRLSNTLADIRERNQTPKIPRKVAANTLLEFTPLMLEVNKLAREMARMRRAQHQQHSNKVAEHASQTDKELRNQSIIHNLATDLRGLIEQTFSVAVMVTQDNTSPSTQVLTANMVEGISMIDEILLLLDKDELPTRRRFTMDTLCNYAHSIERIVETLANGKTFPIRLALEKNLTDNTDFMLTDIHATIRFFSLCLEYWPQQLHTLHTAWYITVGLRTHADRAPALYYEFASDHVERGASHALDAQLNIESNMSPLAKKINNLMKLYGMQRNITQPSPGHTVIQYSYDLIIGKKEDDVARAFKAKYGVRKHILLVGNIEFLTTVGQQFDALYIDHSKRFYDEVGSHAANIDSMTGLVLVDCIGNPAHARRVLAHFNKTHLQQNILRVSVIEKHALLQPFTHETLVHEQFPADEFLTHPILPTDIVRLIYGLNAQYDVSAMIDQFTRETT